MLAVRPKTLAGASIPVMTGSALAFTDGQFAWFPALICLVFAWLMQMAANLINDYFDFLNGTDREDRQGPERVCVQGWISLSAMKKGIFCILLLACLVGSTLLFCVRWELIFIGVVCVLFAYMYTAGPYPLSYKGWGDGMVILFFGLVPVGGTYYVQALTYTPAVVIVSLVCGLVVDTLMVANNYRDRDADLESRKFTLVVRFGEPFGRYLYLWLGIIAPLLCLWFLRDGRWFAALLPQLYLIPHITTWRQMVKIRQGKELNSILDKSARNMLLMGILLTIGLIS